MSNKIFIWISDKNLSDSLSSFKLVTIYLVICWKLFEFFIKLRSRFDHLGCERVQYWSPDRESSCQMWWTYYLKGFHSFLEPLWCRWGKNTPFLGHFWGLNPKIILLQILLVVIAIHLIRLTEHDFSECSSLKWWLKILN